MTTVAARTVQVGGSAYPLILPSIRDPRLHLAAVIISIHILGQTLLGFRVSVPQILAAILTSALIEVVWTFRQKRMLVWPASAMLTGSGVALILRVVGMERGNQWSLEGWYLFALVAAVSLGSKYLIRHQGSHLFNPSNFGLVLAFLVLGSSVIEPLDFWWAPLNVGMVVAYLVVLVGGLLITARLRLLTLAATFWLALAAGLGVLAASGHCMTAAWALQPVCGLDFWRIIITSPEVLIFLFFMITDPKTVPAGKTARVIFAACLAVVCVLLIAPQTTEFGAKVGLLAGLVLMTPARFLFDRWFHAEGPVQAWLAGLPTRLPRPQARSVFLAGGALGSLLVLVGAGIVAAGSPARDSTTELAAATSLEVEIDPTTLPPVSVSAEAAALNDGASDQAAALALALAENLAIEAEAVRRADTSLLRAAADGERLVEMELLIQEAATMGQLPVTNYDLQELHLDVVFTDGPQGGASLALEAAGTKEVVTYDGAGTELGRSVAPFQSTFVLRPGGDEGWLIFSVRS